MARKDENESSGIVVATGSADETRQLAVELAPLLAPGDFIALMGPLGAGKTCFVQGLAAGLGVEGQVHSPTFVLMRVHRGPVTLCHADAYRLDSAEELLDLGFDDWLDGCVIALEWADRVAEALPAERIEVEMSYDGEGRRIVLRGIGQRPASIVEKLKHEDTGD